MSGLIRTVCIVGALVVLASVVVSFIAVAFAVPDYSEGA